MHPDMAYKRLYSSTPELAHQPQCQAITPGSRTADGLCRQGNLGQLLQSYIWVPWATVMAGARSQKALLQLLTGLYRRASLWRVQKVYSIPARPPVEGSSSCDQTPDQTSRHPDHKYSLSGCSDTRQRTELYPCRYRVDVLCHTQHYRECSYLAFLLLYGSVVR